MLNDIFLLPFKIIKNVPFRCYLFYFFFLISCSQKNNQSNGPLHLINAEPEQWQFTTQSYLNISPLQQAAIGCEKVTIGVIDTGADTNHPDLKPIISSLSYNFADDSHSIYDKNLHGTHIAGIIGGIQNNEGIRGTCPNMKVAVLQTSNTTDSFFPISNTIEAIGYAKEKNIPILNGSFGNTQGNDLLKESIENFPGLYIAGAGNEGESFQTKPFYPAAYHLANMITVAALDESMNIADFSSYDPNLVDIGAPGVNILSSIPLQWTDQKVCKQKALGISSCPGTSVAAPHVAAAAGIILAQRPDMKPADIRAKILESANTSLTLMSKIAGGKVLNLGALIIP